MFDPLTQSHHVTWAVAAASTAGVILRPWKVPEAVWAVGGALALWTLGLLPGSDVGRAVGTGTDVYLFLTGMMLLAELARREGLFDVAAGIAVRHARGSGPALFMLVYAIGVVVTVLMSNDATAVVLTPAVYAVTRKAGAKPLPYLLACALVANAASFVLPISNPANLMVFGKQLPPLLTWFERFALPSAASVVITFIVLRLTYRKAIGRLIHSEIEAVTLSVSGRRAAYGIAVTTGVLLLASAFDVALGLPTSLAAAAAAGVVLIRKREAPWELLKGVSWGVLPLVAGLFVLVEGLARTGFLQTLVDELRAAAVAAPGVTPWVSSALVAIGCNLINNLPAGLIAGSVVSNAGVGPSVQSAVAIGIDLGPNLSVTGSLATILWLTAIRREGEDVTAWQFLRIGAVAMPLALLGALAMLWWQG